MIKPDLANVGENLKLIYWENVWGCYFRESPYDVENKLLEPNEILVAVRRVMISSQVKRNNTGVVTDNVKMSNPPDDNAIEEAEIKETGKATEVVAVSIGEEKAQETVRKALAVGAGEVF